MGRSSVLMSGRSARSRPDVLRWTVIARPYSFGEGAFENLDNVVERIDRLRVTVVGESLRQATNIHAYVAAVQAVVANESAPISAEKIQRWSEWALARADRIDP
jgi:hypothetical protein